MGDVSCQGPRVCDCQQHKDGSDPPRSRQQKRAPFDARALLDAGTGPEQPHCRSHIIADPIADVVARRSNRTDHGIGVGKTGTKAQPSLSVNSRAAKHQTTIRLRSQYDASR